MSGAGLLGVDLGLASGLALFGADGRLVRYRSTRFPDMTRLKAALPRIVADHGEVGWIVAEGDRHLAAIWERQARHVGATLVWTTAEEWRAELLLPRERGHTADAKAAAGELARRIIAWSGAARPTSLKHDVAEAICIGLWGALKVGLLSARPRL